MTGFEAEVERLRADFPFLDAGLARRLMRLYGTKARVLLGQVKSIDDLGLRFGDDLYEAEVRYLAAHEWAVTGEDVLWRRTKRGLRLTAEQARDVEEFMTVLTGGVRNAA